MSGELTGSGSLLLIAHSSSLTARYSWLAEFAKKKGDH